MRQRAQIWLGTLVSIQLPNLANLTHDALFDAAFARIASVHRSMSFHDKASDLQRWHRLPVGQVLEVSPDMVQVLQACEHLHQTSQGIFDPRVAQYLIQHQHLPCPPEWHGIQTFDAHVLPWHCEDTTHVRKTAQAWLDLGGIAKGYAIDAAIHVLQDACIEQAIVNAGGDLAVLGEQHISIRHPAFPSQIAHRLTIRNQAIASSAAYFLPSTPTSDTAHTDSKVPTHLYDMRYHSPSTLPSRQPSSSSRPLISSTKHVSYSMVARRAMWADALTKILAASHDPNHPLFARYQAQGLILVSDEAQEVS